MYNRCCILQQEKQIAPCRRPVIAPCIAPYSAPDRLLFKTKCILTNNLGRCPAVVLLLSTQRRATSPCMCDGKLVPVELAVSVCMYDVLLARCCVVTAQAETDARSRGGQYVSPTACPEQPLIANNVSVKCDLRHASCARITSTGTPPLG